MTIQAEIEAKLRESFAPEQLEVINESHLHAGHHHVDGGDHAHFDGTGETHFRIRIVSDSFAAKSRLERHRAINDVLKDELAPNRVHALAIEAHAPGEPTTR